MNTQDKRRIASSKNPLMVYMHYPADLRRMSKWNDSLLVLFMLGCNEKDALLRCCEYDDNPDVVCGDIYDNRQVA